MNKEFLLKTFEEAVRGKPGCLFCHPYKGMIFHETKNFRLLIDTFPVALGHLMISSKEHYGCSGEIPEGIFEELESLKEDLKHKIKSLNGSYIFYEHGRAGSCLSKDPNQKCEHFHMHCLPVNISIQKELRTRFDEIHLMHFEQMPRLFWEHGNYLYFEEANGNLWFYPVSNKIVEPHLLRTLICRELKSPNLARWEDFCDPSPFLNSFDMIKHLQEEPAYDLHG